MVFLLLLIQLHAFFPFILLVWYISLIDFLKFCANLKTIPFCHDLWSSLYVASFSMLVFQWWILIPHSKWILVLVSFSFDVLIWFVYRDYYNCFIKWSQYIRKNLLLLLGENLWDIALNSSLNVCYNQIAESTWLRALLYWEVFDY